MRFFTYYPNAPVTQEAYDRMFHDLLITFPGEPAIQVGDVFVAYRNNLNSSCNIKKQWKRLYYKHWMTIEEKKNDILHSVKRETHCKKNHGESRVGGNVTRRI